MPCNVLKVFKEFFLTSLSLQQQQCNRSESEREREVIQQLEKDVTRDRSLNAKWMWMRVRERERERERECVCVWSPQSFKRKNTFLPSGLKLIIELSFLLGWLGKGMKPNMCTWKIFLALDWISLSKTILNVELVCS